MLSWSPNETGISCDLTFTARTAPIEEPRSLMSAKPASSWTPPFRQFGRWQGWDRKQRVSASRSTRNSGGNQGPLLGRPAP